MKSATPPVLRRGKRIARHLGWQSDYQGFLGATSGLFDPFARFKLPKTSVTLARHRAMKGHLATERRVNETVARLSRTNGL
jgi:hypothetical protein